MTVCIAAICQWIDPNDPTAAHLPMIVGAADRMYSTADTGYEPQQTKIVPLTERVVALIAGDIAGQTAIYQAVIRSLAQIPLTEVDAIAHLFADEFARYRREEAERYVLAPIGLDSSTFVASQRTMDSDQVKRLTDVMQGWKVEVETIVAGVDAMGAHIYQIIDPGVAICENASGFVATGIGRGHAQSQFIRARYNWSQSFARALPLIYSAKRRAEAAPGVGRDTDLFCIGLAGGNHQEIGRPEILVKLQREYKKLIAREERALQGATTEVEAFVHEILKAAQSGPEDESGAPDDEDGV